jgi:hypothetical protein
MRRELGVLTLGLGVALAGAAGGPGAAQPAQRGGPAAAGFTQLFISPCGEPYRGRPGDPYPVALWFKQADLNHDGVVDRAEFRADHAGFFDALDGDGDGVLDGPEMAFYERTVVPDVLGPLAPGAGRVGLASPDGWGEPVLIRVQEIPTPEGSHPGERPGVHYGGDGARGLPGEDLGAQRPKRRELLGAAAFGLLAEAEPVRAADTNLDGRVTKAEFLAAADRRFKLLDKRGDGRLTLDELPMTASQAALAKGR